MAFKTWIIAAAAAATLGGCVSSRQADYPTQCMFEVNAPGSYSYSAGAQVPTAVPAQGGTRAGAAALNACIRRKAGLAPAQTATVGTNVAGQTVRTYTYGAPPS